jgi:GNAT superfamily N-acetyltransferase
MALWTWWAGDVLPSLAPLDGFRADSTTSTPAIAAFTGLAEAEVTARLAARNRCYVARLGGSAVGYGWVAGAAGSIGELDVAFRLVGTDRYLWDFVTLPAWRGRGLYPRLLQHILQAEAPGGQRFWIINAPENAASAAGIGKAGFRVVGDLAFAPDGRPALVPAADPDRARLGAALLGVPLLEPADQGVSPCWGCVMDALRRGTAATCWPAAALSAAPCACGRPQPVPASGAPIAHA